MVTVVRERLIDGVHDVSAGGVALALAEMAVRSETGFRVNTIEDHRTLFSESTGRAVLCVAPERVAVVQGYADDRGVPVTRLGQAGGDRLVVEGLIDVGLDEAVAAWRNRLPDALGAAVTH